MLSRENKVVRYMTDFSAVAATGKNVWQQSLVIGRRLLKKPTALLGGVIFLLIVLSGILAPVLTPYDPIAHDAGNRLLDPSAAHPIGTDEFGRDILTRLLYGSQTVLVVAFGAVAFALLIGTALGVVAGYHGGLVEAPIMRAMDIMLSFPLMLLALTLVVVLGPGVENLILAIGISQIPLFTRLARSLTLSVRSYEFVQAAICIGVPNLGVLRTHILPSIFPPLFVQATSTLGLVILSAAALNFLGLGIQPPTPDWGSMVSDFRRFVFDRPLLPLYPGLAIALLVLSLNMLGDGLVEIADPLASKSRL